MDIEPTLTVGAFLSAGVSCLAVLASAVTINGGIRKRHRENRQDAQDREDRILGEIGRKHDTIDDRLKTVEVTIRDFMPRAEIAQALAHEKAGRVMVQEGHQRSIDRLASDGTEIKIELGRLRERYEGMASDIGEIKALVKEQGRDTAARLDRVGEQIATIAHAPRP